MTEGLETEHKTDTSLLYRTYDYLPVASQSLSLYLDHFHTMSALPLPPPLSGHGGSQSQKVGRRDIRGAENGDSVIDLSQQGAADRDHGTS